MGTFGPWVKCPYAPKQSGFLQFGQLLCDKSLYGGDLGWFGGQLSPSLLALTWLALQPIPPPLRSETHTQSWFWRLQRHDLKLQEEYKLFNISLQQFSNATNAGVSPSGFLFLFLFFLPKEQVLLCLSFWRWRITQTLGPVPKKSYHHLGLSPMRLNELWTYSDDGAARAQAPGCQRSSCGSVWRGRGGTGVASDVVKVQGEDPATPGL